VRLFLLELFRRLPATNCAENAPFPLLDSNIAFGPAIIL